MLLLERANRARTTRIYVGETLRFRLAGPENYWYERQITDLMPESNIVMLDNFPVKLDSIVAIKVPKHGLVRLSSGLLLTFGASLALATTVGALIYNDKDLKLGALYGGAAASFGTGYLLSGPRKLKLGRKHRLRLVEISFPPPPVGRN